MMRAFCRLVLTNLSISNIRAYLNWQICLFSFLKKIKKKEADTYDF